METFFYILVGVNVLLVGVVIGVITSAIALLLYIGGQIYKAKDKIDWQGGNAHTDRYDV